MGRHERGEEARASVVVNGLLVQDAFSVGSPNRAFWSIAIEAQLYVMLPLLLLVARRVSAWAMVGLVAAVVVTIGVLGPHVALMSTALVKFTPDLAVLFAVGLLAAGIVTASEHTRPMPIPITASRPPSLKIILWTISRCAPSAIRTPISRVLCPTE